MIRQLRPQGGIDFVLLQILRLGVYELVELGLPDHVINDHVDMARKLVRPEAAKVANGEHLNLSLSVIRLGITRLMAVPSLDDTSESTGLFSRQCQSIWEGLRMGGPSNE